MMETTKQPWKMMGKTLENDGKKVGT